jgi:hypothetical protein
VPLVDVPELALKSLLLLGLFHRGVVSSQAGAVSSWGLRAKLY